MCTLIVGRGVLAPGTVVLGANRDEDPDRPSDPPDVLSVRPRVVGGRDRVAGGTWLAVRGTRAVLAMLNRREQEPPPADRRSRGRLLLDVATVASSGDLARDAREAARAAVERHAYAPFSLVFASPEACWIMSGTPRGAPRTQDIGPGWHVVTHAELDDPEEPRTTWLLDGLRGWRPRDPADADRGLIERLSAHGDGEPGGVPPVCIHDGRMRTVSAALIRLAPGHARYLHAEGRPCETPPVDFSRRLAEGAGATEQP